MKPFKLHDPVIWQDEQSGYFTGIITEVNKRGFRIDWDTPSPYIFIFNEKLYGMNRYVRYYGEEKNEVFYRWEYLDLKTLSGNSIIRLDISKIRETKIDSILP